MRIKDETIKMDGHTLLLRSAAEEDAFGILGWRICWQLFFDGNAAKLVQ